MLLQVPGEVRPEVTEPPTTEQEEERIRESDILEERG